ncbi:MAG TPA: DUF1801 domain-containing protein [Candidatus Polarisedimenticolia bacterium]|nr:DUF1801 domain-containing protein [Candidatus Polarisedimenticolia bacterium]
MKKGSGVPRDTDEYIAMVPEPARSTMKKIRAVIRSVVPREATEIISYGMPAFKHHGVLIWFAAFSNHCSLFPTASVIEAFKHELKGYSTSKGTIQFPVNKTLPAALVKKLVKARIAQSESKKRR